MTNAATITVAENSINSNDVLIAETIVDQILHFDPLSMGCIACPPSKRSVIERGVLMRRVIVKQMERETYGNIEITLNGSDLYDIRGYSTDKWGQPKKIIFEYSDVYFDQLWEKLRKIWE